jgi:hypothetical protein
MRIFSKLLWSGIGAAILFSAAPAGGQVGAFTPYPVARGTFEQDRTERLAALRQCMNSTISLLELRGMPAAARPSFDIFGYEHRNNGDLRVHGAVMLDRIHAEIRGEPGLTRSLEFSCDVDSRGNLRKLGLG